MIRAKNLKDRCEGMWAKDTNTDCMLWTGSINAYGYGRLKFLNKFMLAHRAAWILSNGPIPKGMFVCHKCDVRSCGNPLHLFLGTHLDNMKDRDNKGRQAKGEKIALSVFTKAQIKEIRKKHSMGRSCLSLSKEYGVTDQAIGAIVKYKTWKHI